MARQLHSLRPRAGVTSVMWCGLKARKVFDGELRRPMQRSASCRLSRLHGWKTRDRVTHCPEFAAVLARKLYFFALAFDANKYHTAPRLRDTELFRVQCAMRERVACVAKTAAEF